MSSQHPVTPRWVFRLAWVLAALAGASPVVANEPPTGPRSAILITIDTLRADALGFAGNDGVSTPTLDRMAAAGRVFSGAHAHSVTTLPSHASILTGLYPFQHGARHNGSFVLPPDVPTLAAQLSAEGFATAAFIAAFPLDSRFGLDRGFATYDDDLGEPDSLFRYSERRGDIVVERATSWWKTHQGQRRFLWLHLFDPHAPYDPPEPFKSRYVASPYLGEVAAVDAYLTPLLEGFLAGREESTLIAFTSDHGEALGEHGEATHGYFAYEATLKVPLILWGVGVEPGVDLRPARHIDLMPTLLEALGAAAAADTLPGRSLLAPAVGHPEVSFFEALSANMNYGWAPLRGVLKGGLKLIALPLAELYDLESDPGESQNRYPQHRTVARGLAELLPRESIWPPEAGELSAEEAVHLRSLGYLGGPTEGKQRFTAEDDLKNLLALEHDVQQLADLATRGETRAAIEIARAILVQRPSMGVVYVYLSTLLIEAGDPLGSIEVMRQAQQRGLAGKELLRQLGLTLVEAGRPRDALEVLEPLAKEPGDVEARNHLALAQVYLGRVREASAMLMGIAADHPKDARTLENLSFLSITRRRFAEAREHAEKALAIDPGRVSSWNNLGIALYNQGSASAAIEAWNKGLALAPDDRESLLNLGLVEAANGDREAAGKTLQRFLDVATGPTWETKRRQAMKQLKELGPGE